MTDDQSPAALARSIDEARQRFVSFVQHRTDGEWRSCPLDGDPRPVGVIADHVAHAYEYLAGWIASLASGEQVEVSSELVDELNAEHAGDAEGVTLLPLEELAEDDAAAIAGLAFPAAGRGGVQIRLHDKSFALEALARHFGLYDQAAPEADSGGARALLIARIEALAAAG